MNICIAEGHRTREEIATEQQHWTPEQKYERFRKVWFQTGNFGLAMDAVPEIDASLRSRIVGEIGAENEGWRAEMWNYLSRQARSRDPKMADYLTSIARDVRAYQPVQDLSDEMLMNGSDWAAALREVPKILNRDFIQSVLDWHGSDLSPEETKNFAYEVASQVETLRPSLARALRKAASDLLSEGDGLNNG